MSDDQWVFDQTDGQLLVHTDVTGRAARLGHRLTIRMNTWQATVQWSDGAPIRVQVHVDLAGLEIMEGAGGIKPLSSPEKVIARGNALGSLDGDDYPMITFTAETITQTDSGYDLAGTLTIHGKSQDHVVHLVTEELPDAWRLTCETPVTQSDFGMKPYSLMMGSLAVVDEVRVSFEATRARP